MKIGKIELTRERLIIVVPVLTVIALLLMYIIFYVPLIKEIKKKQLEYKSIEAQLLDKRNIIETARKKNKKIVLVTEKNIAQPIDELTKHCSLMGINIISISPKELIDEQSRQFKILPIALEIKSNDQQFTAFIGSLAELKNALIKVKSFDLAADKEDKTKIRANLVLDMYLANAQNAE